LFFPARTPIAGKIALRGLGDPGGSEAQVAMDFTGVHFWRPRSPSGHGLHWRSLLRIYSASSCRRYMMGAGMKQQRKNRGGYFERAGGDVKLGYITVSNWSLLH